MWRWDSGFQQRLQKGLNQGSSTVGAEGQGGPGRGALLRTGGDRTRAPLDGGEGPCVGLIPLLSSQRLALVTETSGGRWASSILWPALGQDGVCAEALLTRHDLTDPQHPAGWRCSDKAAEPSVVCVRNTPNRVPVHRFTVKQEGGGRQWPPVHRPHPKPLPPPCPDIRMREGFERRPSGLTVTDSEGGSGPCPPGSLRKEHHLPITTELSN